MLFNSFVFIAFFIITCFIYYLPFAVIKRSQVLILITASLVFYAWQKPALLFLLLASIVLNAAISFLLQRSPVSKAKKLLIAGVVLNLLILAFFKYSPLIASTLASELDLKGSVLNLLITIPLPIGISFYTFEGISLLADLYSGKAVMNEQRRSFRYHLSDTALFISFFPHLIAGPILKARDFYPQIGPRYFKDVRWELVCKKLILGYFLKMVVADNLKDYTVDISFPYFQGLSTFNLLLLLFAYSMQIFADFAGYSLIAIGLAGVLGYQLPANFNFPYISASFAEFWTRWHISLSTWLRDYLYIPLGGNRISKGRTYLNLFVVMMLGGLWHGAAWSFAVWGAAHGLLLMAERFFSKGSVKQHKRSVFRVLMVFTAITFLWLLFKLTHFSQVIAFVQSLYNNIGLHIKVGFKELSIVYYSCFIIAYHVYFLLRPELISAGSSKIRYAENVVYALLLFFIITDSGAGGTFIYFQF